ncbi:MAG TPA: DinB family protein [Bacteroidia bacterium]
MTKNELLNAYDRIGEATEKMFDCTQEEFTKTYGPGKWNVRQILHHLADVELAFHNRLKKIIAEPKQVIWAYEPDMWANEFSYKDAPLDKALRVYQLCRELNRELAETYFETMPEKEFVHSKMGLRTLASEMERLATHNEHHLNQIRQALTA